MDSYADDADSRDVEIEELLNERDHLRDELRVAEDEIARLRVGSGGSEELFQENAALRADNDGLHSRLQRLEEQENRLLDELREAKRVAALEADAKVSLQSAEQAANARMVEMDRELKK